MSFRVDEKSWRRRVTEALSQLDLLFTLGRYATGRNYWTLAFSPETEEGPAGDLVQVALQPADEVLMIGARVAVDVAATPEYPLGTSADARLLDSLVRLNAKLFLARIGIDGSGNLVSLAQLPFDHVSASALQAAMGAVVTGAAAARRLVAGDSLDRVLRSFGGGS